jgi:hypothetical protein
MRHRAVLSAALVVLALAATAAATAAGSATPGFYGCRVYTVKHPAAVVRPRSIVVACGDGNFYLTGIHWASWTAAKATGTGTGHQNDCTPNCAAGHFHAYPARLTLTKPRSCDGHKVFTTLEWRFTRTTPKGIALSGATTFNC